MVRRIILLCAALLSIGHTSIQAQGKGSISVADTLAGFLPQYEIVSPELKMLLDRVIDGKEHTNFWNTKPIEAKPRHEGSTFNLYIIAEPRIDTTYDTVNRRYNTLYMLYLYHESDIIYLGRAPKIPQPLKKKAPDFSFDSASTTVEVYEAYEPQSFTDGTYGFIEYRGCIFFITMPHEEIDPRFLRPLDNIGRVFKYREMPIWIYDPATWTYTYQQGHWYRWRELPRGY